MDLALRLFEPGDAAELAALIRRNLWEVNSRDYPRAQLEWLAAYYSEDRVRAIAEEGHLYVAVSGGRLAGCGAVTPTGRTCELSAVFVLPEFHGRGVGRAIINTLERDPYALAAEKAELGASITAHEFYQKLGYTYRGGLKLLDGNRLYLMEKAWV